MRKALFLGLGVLLTASLTTGGFAAEKRSNAETRPSPGQGKSGAATVPFAGGETLSYAAKLNDLPAGDGSLRLWLDRQPERDLYRVMAHGRTNELVDMLFRLRGTADGAFTATGLRPISFRFAYTERDRPRELGVRLDPGKNLLIGSHTRHERARERSEPATGVYDPLSALYVLRSQTLTPGATQRLEVFTGKDRYRIVAHVIRREEILVSGEPRSAVRLQLEGTKVGDSRQRSAFPEETLLWVSADAKHVPLKLESSLPFGVLVVELNER